MVVFCWQLSAEAHPEQIAFRFLVLWPKNRKCKLSQGRNLCQLRLRSLDFCLLSIQEKFNWCTSWDYWFGILLLLWSEEFELLEFFLLVIICFCLFLLLLAANKDVKELNLEQFQRFSAAKSWVFIVFFIKSLGVWPESPKCIPLKFFGREETVEIVRL